MENRRTVSEVCIPTEAVPDTHFSSDRGYFKFAQNLQIGDLPYGWQSQDALDVINHVSQRVVLIYIPRMSSKRPTSIFSDRPHYGGTGFAYYVDRNIVKIRTNLHVIFNAEEAKSAIVQFSLKVRGKRNLRVFRLQASTIDFYTNVCQDFSSITCHTSERLRKYLHVFCDVPVLWESSFFGEGGQEPSQNVESLDDREYVKFPKVPRKNVEKTNPENRNRSQNEFETRTCDNSDNSVDRKLPQLSFSTIELNGLKESPESSRFHGSQLISIKGQKVMSHTAWSVAQDKTIPEVCRMVNQLQGLTDLTESENNHDDSGQTTSGRTDSCHSKYSSTSTTQPLPRRCRLPSLEDGDFVGILSHPGGMEKSFSVGPAAMHRQTTFDNHRLPYGDHVSLLRWNQENSERYTKKTAVDLVSDRFRSCKNRLYYTHTTFGCSGAPVLLFKRSLQHLKIPIVDHSQHSGTCYFSDGDNLGFATCFTPPAPGPFSTGHRDFQQCYSVIRQQEQLVPHLRKIQRYANLAADSTHIVGVKTAEADSDKKIGQVAIVRRHCLSGHDSVNQHALLTHPVMSEMQTENIPEPKNNPRNYIQVESDYMPQKVAGRSEITLPEESLKSIATHKMLSTKTEYISAQEVLESGSESSVNTKITSAQAESFGKETVQDETLCPKRVDGVLSTPPQLKATELISDNSNNSSSCTLEGGVKNDKFLQRSPMQHFHIPIKFKYQKTRPRIFKLYSKSNHDESKPYKGVSCHCNHLQHHQPRTSSCADCNIQKASTCHDKLEDISASSNIRDPHQNATHCNHSPKANNADQISKRSLCAVMNGRKDCINNRETGSMQKSECMVDNEECLFTPTINENDWPEVNKIQQIIPMSIPFSKTSSHEKDSTSAASLTSKSKSLQEEEMYQCKTKKPLSHSSPKKHLRSESSEEGSSPAVDKSETGTESRAETSSTVCMSEVGFDAQEQSCVSQSFNSADTSQTRDFDFVSGTLDSEKVLQTLDSIHISPTYDPRNNSKAQDFRNTKEQSFIYQSVDNGNVSDALDSGLAVEEAKSGSSSELRNSEQFLDSVHDSEKRNSTDAFQRAESLDTPQTRSSCAVIQIQDSSNDSQERNWAVPQTQDSSDASHTDLEGSSDSSQTPDSSDVSQPLDSSDSAPNASLTQCSSDASETRNSWGILQAQDSPYALQSKESSDMSQAQNSWNTLKTQERTHQNIQSLYDSGLCNADFQPNKSIKRMIDSSPDKAPRDSDHSELSKEEPFNLRHCESSYEESEHAIPDNTSLQTCVVKSVPHIIKQIEDQNLKPTFIVDPNTGHMERISPSMSGSLTDDESMETDHLESSASVAVDIAEAVLAENTSWMSSSDIGMNQNVSDVPGVQRSDVVTLNCNASPSEPSIYSNTWRGTRTLRELKVLANQHKGSGVSSSSSASMQTIASTDLSELDSTVRISKDSHSLFGLKEMAERFSKLETPNIDSTEGKAREESDFQRTEKYCSEIESQLLCRQNGEASENPFLQGGQTEDQVMNTSQGMYTELSGPQKAYEINPAYFPRTNFNGAKNSFTARSTRIPGFRGLQNPVMWRPRQYHHRFPAPSVQVHPSEQYYNVSAEHTQSNLHMPQNGSWAQPRNADDMSEVPGTQNVRRNAYSEWPRRYHFQDVYGDKFPVPLRQPMERYNCTTDHTYPATSAGTSFSMPSQKWYTLFPNRDSSISQLGKQKFDQSHSKGESRMSTEAVSEKPDEFSQIFVSSPRSRWTATQVCTNSWPAGCRMSEVPKTNSAEKDTNLCMPRVSHQTWNNIGGDHSVSQCTADPSESYCKWSTISEDDYHEDMNSATRKTDTGISDKYCVSEKSSHYRMLDCPSKREYVSQSWPSTANMCERDVLNSTKIHTGAEIYQQNLDFLAEGFKSDGFKAAKQYRKATDPRYIWPVAGSYRHDSDHLFPQHVTARTAFSTKPFTDTSALDSYQMPKWTNAGTPRFPQNASYEPEPSRHFKQTSQQYWPPKSNSFPYRFPVYQPQNVSRHFQEVQTQHKRIEHGYDPFKTQKKPNPRFYAVNNNNAKCHSLACFASTHPGKIADGDRSVYFQREAVNLNQSPGPSSVVHSPTDNSSLYLSPEYKGSSLPGSDGYLSDQQLQSSSLNMTAYHSSVNPSVKMSKLSGTDSSSLTVAAQEQSSTASQSRRHLRYPMKSHVNHKGIYQGNEAPDQSYVMQRNKGAIFENSSSENLAETAEGDGSLQTLSSTFWKLFDVDSDREIDDSESDKLYSTMEVTETNRKNENTYIETDSAAGCRFTGEGRISCLTLNMEEDTQKGRKTGLSEECPSEVVFRPSSKTRSEQEHRLALDPEEQHSTISESAKVRNIVSKSAEDSTFEEVFGMTSEDQAAARPTKDFQSVHSSAHCWIQNPNSRSSASVVSETGPRLYDLNSVVYVVLETGMVNLTSLHNNKPLTGRRDVRDGGSESFSAETPVQSHGRNRSLSQQPSDDPDYIDMNGTSLRNFCNPDSETGSVDEKFRRTNKFENNPSLASCWHACVGPGRGLRYNGQNFVSAAARCQLSVQDALKCQEPAKETLYSHGNPADDLNQHGDDYAPFQNVPDVGRNDRPSQRISGEDLSSEKRSDQKENQHTLNCLCACTPSTPISSQDQASGGFNFPCTNTCDTNYQNNGMSDNAYYPSAQPVYSFWVYSLPCHSFYNPFYVTDLQQSMPQASFQQAAFQTWCQQQLPYTGTYPTVYDYGWLQQTTLANGVNFQSTDQCVPNPSLESAEQFSMCNPDLEVYTGQSHTRNPSDKSPISEYNPPVSSCWHQTATVATVDVLDTSFMATLQELNIVQVFQSDKQSPQIEPVSEEAASKHSAAGLGAVPENRSSETSSREGLYVKNKKRASSRRVRFLQKQKEAQPLAIRSDPQQPQGPLRVRGKAEPNEETTTASPQSRETDNGLFPAFERKQISTDSGSEKSNRELYYVTVPVDIRVRLEKVAKWVTTQIFGCPKVHILTPKDADTFYIQRNFNLTLQIMALNS